MRLVSYIVVVKVIVLGVFFCDKLGCLGLLDVNNLMLVVCIERGIL